MVKQERLKRDVATQLRQLKHALPFSPFVITTVSGEKLILTGADRFMVSPRGETAMLYPKGQTSLKMIDLGDVTGVKPLRTTRRKNGRR